MKKQDFKVGDVVSITTLLRRHGGGETLRAGAEGVVVKTYPRGVLMVIDLVTSSVEALRVVPVAACKLEARPPNVAIGWNMIAAIKRSDPASDVVVYERKHHAEVDALRAAPVFTTGRTGTL